MNAAPTGTLIHLDPATIATDKNIRDDLQITTDWVKNLKQHGVRTPVSAYWDTTLEQYQVEAGHRRTVGAVQAGLTTIPVYVIDRPAADTDRVVDQLIENVQRAALHDTEEATAYRQLSFAMPAMQIAKRTNTKLARIGDAIKVAGSSTAEKALTEHQLTIDDALAFAEFEDDPDAIASLTKTLNERPEQLTHHAARLRQQRADATEVATHLASLNLDPAVTLLDGYPGLNDNWMNLDRVQLSEEDSTSPALEQIPVDHLGVWVRKERVRWEGDTPIDEVTVGWYVRDCMAIGYWIPTYYRPDSAKEAKPGLTDEEREARRVTRENNKLWGPATTVRLAWVKELIERRALPRDAAALAALWFSQMRTATSSGRAGRIAHDLLGLTMAGSGMYNADTRELEKFVYESPNQGMHVLLAIAIGSIEGSLDEKSGWQGMYPRTLLPLYLKQLCAWGYTLSDIEAGIVQKHDLAQTEAAN